MTPRSITTPTPTLTKHARQRCAEMGISTKVAKRIVQHADVLYDTVGTDGNPGRIAFWKGEPDYGVVLARDENHVLTVIYNTNEEYVRGTTPPPSRKTA